MNVSTNKQIGGGGGAAPPMGSSVSPIVANLYMEQFEQLALETALALPRLWLQYVDDTFTICLQDKIQELTDHIKGVHESSLHMAPLGIRSCRTFCSDLA